MRLLVAATTIFCAVATASCRRTVYVDRPVEVLVPVAADPPEPCPRSTPPVRPTGKLFDGCVMPEIVACLSRSAMESVVAYLEESEAWFALYEGCHAEPVDAGPQ